MVGLQDGSFRGEDEGSMGHPVYQNPSSAQPCLRHPSTSSTKCGRRWRKWMGRKFYVTSMLSYSTGQVIRGNVIKDEIWQDDGAFHECVWLAAHEDTKRWLRAVKSDLLTVVYWTNQEKRNRQREKYIGWTLPTCQSMQNAIRLYKSLESVRTISQLTHT